MGSKKELQAAIAVLGLCMLVFGCTKTAESENSKKQVKIGVAVYNEEDVNGDANGDGEITANDAAYIARKLAEQNKKDLDYRADFNKSTDVTALDAAEVAKYLAEKSID